MQCLRTTIILAVILCCSACGAKQYLSKIMGSGADNTEPPAPLVDFAEKASITQLWSENVGSGTDELFIKLVPAIMDGRVIVADTNGTVSAYESISGKSLWRVKSKLPITGGPGADFSIIMVGTSEGEVVTFLPSTGEELWKARVSSEILSSPRESDNVIIVRTIDGKIFALEATTGKRLWVYDRTVPALTLRGTSTPVIAGDTVIAGFDGGRVTALDLKSGKLNWETKAAISRGRSELERMVDIDAQPLIVDDVIYVATFQSNVSAISLETGQTLWRRDIASHSELGADGSYLFVTDDQGNIWALDRFSGSSIWKQEKLLYRNPTGPAVIGDKVVAGDGEGYLHWMDRTTGDFVARMNISGSPILVQPKVHDNVLYVYTSDGQLGAYNYADRTIVSTQADVEVSTDAATEAEETRNQTTKENDDGSLLNNIIDIFTPNAEDEEFDDY